MANPLQFSTFVWPENPERFRMRCPLDYELEPNTANGLWLLSKVCRMPRRFECEGYFSGSSAYAYFTALSALFLTGTAAELIHPNWGSFPALLTLLEVLEEPRENLIHYRAEFLEMHTTA